jgi:hypothetical protein
MEPIEKVSPTYINVRRPTYINVCYFENVFIRSCRLSLTRFSDKSITWYIFKMNMGKHEHAY